MTETDSYERSLLYALAAMGVLTRDQRDYEGGAAIVRAYAEEACGPCLYTSLTVGYSPESCARRIQRARMDRTLARNAPASW